RAPPRDCTDPPGVLQRRRMPRSYRWVILAVCTLAFVEVHVHRLAFSPLIPTFVADLGITYTTAGTIQTAYFWTYTLFQVPVGVLTDRWGARRVMLVFLSLLGLGTVLFAASRTYPESVGARALIGAGDLAVQADRPAGVRRLLQHGDLPARILRRAPPRVGGGGGAPHQPPHRRHHRVLAARRLRERPTRSAEGRVPRERGRQRRGVRRLRPGRARARLRRRGGGRGCDWARRGRHGHTVRHGDGDVPAGARGDRDGRPQRLLLRGRHVPPRP